MKRLFFIALAVLAVIPVSTSCKNARKGDTLVVMSYNIRNAKADDGENDWEKRCSATPAMLDAINPDIFGVQEAYPCQVQYITDNCPRYASFGVGRDDGVDKGEHMSIFYNTDALEKLDGGTYWLSETPDEPSFGWDARCRRTATWALMRDKDSDRKFFFVNTHLDHKGKVARREGLALIVNKIAEMNAEGLPMVLTGDFNVHPDDSCLIDLDKMMLSARVTAEQSDDTPSFNGWGSSATVIDYIYYSSFSACKSFRVVTEQFAGKPFISDHYPIVSTLEY